MEITLTSRPSALEVKRAAEVLKYERTVTAQQILWARQIIKAHKEGQK